MPTDDSNHPPFPGYSGYIYGSTAFGDYRGGYGRVTPPDGADRIVNADPPHQTLRINSYGYGYVGSVSTGESTPAPTPPMPRCPCGGTDFVEVNRANLDYEITEWSWSAWNNRWEPSKYGSRGELYDTEPIEYGCYICQNCGEDYDQVPCAPADDPNDDS